jgi:hypothetical protein
MMEKSGVDGCWSGLTNDPGSRPCRRGQRGCAKILRQLEMQTNRNLRALSVRCVLAILASQVLGCGPSRTVSPPHPAGTIESAFALLLQQLRYRSSAWASPDSADIHTWVVRSAVVSNLSYVWGEYYPPRTMHVGFREVVGVRDAVIVAIHHPDDWVSATGGFVPTTPREAVASCAELVSVTSRWRNPAMPPRPYISPASLDSLRFATTSPASMRDSLSIPSVETLSDGSWSTLLWMIESRNINRYRCEISSTRTTTTIVDSLPGYGYY